MVKLGGSICIGIGVCLFFFGRAREIRRQLEEIIYLKKIMLLLKGEIHYTISQMSEIFEKLSLHVHAPYQQIFFEFAKDLEENRGQTFFEKWEEKVIHPLQSYVGGGKELDKLEELGENLGYLDKEMQINYIDLFLEQLEGSIEERKEQVRYKERLYHCLGILGAVFIVLCFL